MFKCKFIDLLFSVLPLKRWQDFLVRRHIRNCAACRRKLATSEEARRLFVPENKIGNLEGVWPAIESRLDERKAQKPQVQRRWRWAFAATLLLVIVFCGVWVYLSYGPGKESPEQPFAGRFQINSIEIDSEPAQAFVYYPRNSKTYFIWVEKKT